VLVVAGAGHVGQALASLAAQLGFDVDVIDDRADYASRQRFPGARNLVVGEVEDALRTYPLTPNTYVVIVTRGHRHDGRALEAVIRSGAKYVGLIGSRSKVKLIFKDLVSRGFDVEELLKVHAPVGLDVGAVTVPEIALSIAAELVAVRRGRDGIAAKPMKTDADALRVWLSTNDDDESGDTTSTMMAVKS
jgi:xanthine dehydrogenase accessory factor